MIDGNLAMANVLEYQPDDIHFWGTVLNNEGIHVKIYIDYQDRVIVLFKGIYYASTDFKLIPSLDEIRKIANTIEFRLKTEQL